jgi:hypothetical protein
MSIGEAWGQLVRFGSDQALADLALCDLACAELSLVRQVRPALEGVPLGDVLALLIEPGSRRVRTVEADLTITTAFNLWEEGGMEQYEAQAAKRVERMASALNSVLAPNVEVVEQRLTQWGAAVGQDNVARARAAFDSPRPPSAEIAARYPTFARAEAEEHVEQRAAWLEPLAATTRKRIEQGAPAGSRWAENTGCGCEIEGEGGTGGVACGMGRVPEMGRRFLAYWVE